MASGSSSTAVPVPSTSNVPRQRRYSRSSASNSSISQAGSFKPPGRSYYGFTTRRDGSSASKETNSEFDEAVAALGGVGSWTAGREDIRDGQSSLSHSFLSPFPRLFPFLHLDNKNAIPFSNDPATRSDEATTMENDRRTQIDVAILE